MMTPGLPLVGGIMSSSLPRLGSPCLHMPINGRKKVSKRQIEKDHSHRGKTCLKGKGLKILEGKAGP